MDMEEVRAAFELEMSGRGYGLNRNKDGYSDPELDRRWEDWKTAWQAALASQPSKEQVLLNAANKLEEIEKRRIEREERLGIASQQGEAIARITYAGEGSERRIAWLALEKTKVGDRLYTTPQPAAPSVLNEVDRLRICAKKYLGWLGIEGDLDKALDSDLHNPEMIGAPNPGQQP